MHKRRNKGRTKSKNPPPQLLPVIRPKVAGIDIGSREHWVCPWQIDTVKQCNEGSHKGFPGGDAQNFVRNVEQLANELLKL